MKAGPRDASPCPDTWNHLTMSGWGRHDMPIIRRALATRWLLLIAALAAGEPLVAQSPFDILIRGGRVIDGTGNPWFRADVGIRGDRVVAVGADLRAAGGSTVIDARGKYVVPGFIDVHSHADEGSGPENRLRDPNDPRRRAAPALVAQGITTAVVNPDGESPWPIADQRRDLERLGTGPNTILMVGHATVRSLAMGEGNAQRAASPAEVQRMRAFVRQGMAEGARGLTTGLEYDPMRHSDTEELIGLVEEIAPFDGVYIAHERSAGEPMWYWPSRDEPGPTTIQDATRETIEIGERTGATVVSTHYKTRGARWWGGAGMMIELIERARARGVRAYVDQYPYNSTSSDGQIVLIPGWALGYDGWGDRDERADYAAALEGTLADPEQATAVRRDIAFEMERRGGAENIRLMEHPDRSLVGTTVLELSRAWDVEPVEVAIRLQLEGDRLRTGGARLRGFSLLESDIEALMRRPWTATGTDGWPSLPEDGLEVLTAHPRSYGTFVRKIAEYARDRSAITVEHAVRSSTSPPAEILGLRDRGLLRDGMAADVVVFDLEDLGETATFEAPHGFPTGVEQVLINGQFVIRDGEPTGALPGRVLIRSGESRARAEAR